ncbi:hypothetical protein LSAT2_031739 [Lamellibrachia satsuma]|nr:hypothetical protein LSAT2_031739 [Lamellibrachia satsuma]
MITQTDAWLAEMGQSHLVAFAAAVWALFACMANAGAPPNVLRGPFNPPNVNIAPDLNLAIDYVMSSPNQCGVTRLRRNGMIYSHKELYEGLQKEGLSLLELNKTSRYYYPDDINCTFTVCVGTGWQVQLLFPIGLQLECATDNSTCDCLEVYDGYTTDAPLIRKLCGDNNGTRGMRRVAAVVRTNRSVRRVCRHPYFQLRFEFCVHDDVDGLLKRCSEMHLDGQVALFVHDPSHAYGGRSKPSQVYPSLKSSRVRPLLSCCYTLSCDTLSCDTLPVEVNRLR